MTICPVCPPSLRAGRPAARRDREKPMAGQRFVAISLRKLSSQPLATFGTDHSARSDP